MFAFFQRLFARKPKVGELLWIGSTAFTIKAVGERINAEASGSRITCQTSDAIYLPRYNFWTLLGREGMLPALTK